MPSHHTQGNIQTPSSALLGPTISQISIPISFLRLWMCGIQPSSSELRLHRQTPGSPVSPLPQAPSESASTASLSRSPRALWNASKQAIALWPEWEASTALDVPSLLHELISWLPALWPSVCPLSCKQKALHVAHTVTS